MHPYIDGVSPRQLLEMPEHRDKIMIFPRDLVAMLRKWTIDHTAAVQRCGAVSCMLRRPGLLWRCGLLSR